MAVLSGKDGTLYIDAAEITPVSNWKLAVTAGRRNYVANDTGGWKKRVSGAKDCNGSLEIKLTHSGKAPVESGDAVTLKLHVDATGGNYYRVEALIGRMGVVTDINGGEVVAHRVDFWGNGSVTPYGILSTNDA